MNVCHYSCCNVGCQRRSEGCMFPLPTSPAAAWTLRFSWIFDFSLEERKIEDTLISIPRHSTPFDKLRGAAQGRLCGESGALPTHLLPTQRGGDRSPQIVR